MEIAIQRKTRCHFKYPVEAISYNTTARSEGSNNSIQNPWGGGKISSFSTDYRNIEIPQDSVIYCDIPYMGTNEYTGVPIFDYEAFYDWAESQVQPLFISSYDMPRDRFRCVAEFKHNSTLSASSVVPVVERVFVPMKQEHKTIRQLSLFD
jgi:hypothetical protein